MITVSIFKQSNYPVNDKKVKDAVRKTLQTNGVKSDSVVDVSIVGESKMDEINKAYYKDEVYSHPVFSFPTNEDKEKFPYPPKGKNYLGEIVVSYPEAKLRAEEEGKLIDDIVCDLVEHSIMHLLGVHHDEKVE